MSNPKPNIQIPVDLTNPGQFFACCGLLELADRLWPGAEGWFESSRFCIRSDSNTFTQLLDWVRSFRITNTMTKSQLARLEHLGSLSKKQRSEDGGFDEEKKQLESLRREAPIVLLGGSMLTINWFQDDESGGSRYKTWAGQQSVFDITQAMHTGLASIPSLSEETLWSDVRGIGLPFNFDSDLGGQGSALDIGFGFDPLAGSEATRIEGSCKPALEFLCFVGLQRFRPRKVQEDNRFVYNAWNLPLPPSVASAAACQMFQSSTDSNYEFRLLYRTKYLKSFLPAQPFQGDTHE